MMKLRTLGGLSVEDARGETPDAIPIGVGRRRLTLLALLAAEPKPVPRDKVLALFWPSRDTSRARHALDQTVYALRRDLGCDDLILGRDELSLNACVMTSDVVQLRAAVTRNDWERVVDTYAGPFLDGVFVDNAPEFDDWAARERADVERDIDEALEGLAARAVERNDHREAAEWWQRLATRNPGRTGVIVALMSTLAEAGERRAALQHAEQYHAKIREDGDFEPNPAVALLAEQIRKPSAVRSPASLLSRSFVRFQ